MEGLASVNPDADLAILKIDGKDLPILELADNTPLLIGSTVYALGNPKGFTNTFSSGLISGLRKFNDKMTIIQTSAPISPGSSGGPLLNSDGQAIGITSFFLAEGQNLNFAVSVKHISEMVIIQDNFTLLPNAGYFSEILNCPSRIREVWLALINNKRDKAEELYIKLYDFFGESLYKDYNFWVLAGYMLETHKQPNDFKTEKAIEAFKKAILIKPDLAVARLFLANLLSRNQHFEEAFLEFKKLIELGHYEEESYLGLIHANDMLSHIYYLDMYGALRKGIKKSSSIESCVKYHKRIEKRIIRKEISTLDASLSREALSKAISLTPIIASDFYFLGSAYESLKEDDKAFENFKIAVNLDQKLGDAYAGIGRYYLRHGLDKEAVKTFKTGIELAPNDASIYGELAYHYWGEKQYEDAIKTLCNCIKVNPNDFESYYLLIMIYKEVGKFSEAKTLIEKAPKSMAPLKKLWMIDLDE